MSTHERNPVARAINALGGMTRSVVASGYSESTWHRWRRMGRVADPQACFVIGDLTGISARELAGATGSGPGGDDVTPGQTAARDAVASARRATRETARAVASLRAGKPGRKYPWQSRRNRDRQLAVVAAARHAASPLSRAA